MLQLSLKAKMRGRSRPPQTHACQVKMFIHHRQSPAGLTSRPTSPAHAQVGRHKTLAQVELNCALI
eukprot:3484807-Pyramimonas_sp.AAC.3